MGRYLGNQRIRTGLLVNWQLLPEVELSPAGYPLMQPVDMPADDSATLARFKDALTCEFPQSQGLQFFQDDYQFERVWAQPEKYLEVVARFKFTLQTNFSLYSDYPRPLNQWNHFRNQLLGAWWQARGLTVVPVAAWGDPEDDVYAFDGIPTDSCIAISTWGFCKNAELRQRFLRGLGAFLDAKKPTGILFYGKVSPEVANLCAGIPAREYPSTIGSTRFDAKAWARKLAKGDKQ